MSDFKKFLQENKKELDEVKRLSKLEKALSSNIEDVKAKAKKYRPMVRKTENKSRIKKPVLLFNEKEFDFLKFYAIVKRWAMYIYELTYDEMELLMYFYSEQTFTKREFNLFTRHIVHQKKNINNFIEKGLVEELENYNKDVKIDLNKIYKLTFRAQRIIASIYKKMTLTEDIDEYSGNNKLFVEYSTSFSQKNTAKLIMEMNKKRLEIIDGKKEHKFNISKVKKKRSN